MDPVQAHAIHKAETIRIWAMIFLVLGLIASLLGVLYGVNILCQSVAPLPLHPGGLNIAHQANMNLSMREAILNIQRQAGAEAIGWSLLLATVSVLQYHFLTGFGNLLNLAGKQTLVQPKQEDKNKLAADPVDEKLEQLLQQTADGKPEHQFLVAKYYETMGDAAEALKWYLLAAEQGRPGAQFCLAVMFLEGKGTPKDVAQGKKWLELAAANGNVEAATRLKAFYICPHCGAENSKATPFCPTCSAKNADS